MAKLLRSRDRILLGLAVLGDWLDEVVGGGHRAYQAGKLGFYTPPGYSTNALQAAVSRMLKTGLISKIIKDGEVFWELTGGGRTQVKKSFPLLEWQQRSWDGWWRIVIFDIKETQKLVRNKLRHKLVELGFGQWQKSVYVSPHDVAEDMREFLHEFKLANQASVFVAKELWLEGGEEKIVKMWQLEKINLQYEKVINFWEQIKVKKLTQKELRQIMKLYLTAVEKDPFLPKELLPKDWFGFEAQKILHLLKRSYREV